MKLSKEQLESLLGPLTVSPNKRNLYGRCPVCKELEFGVSIEDNHRCGCFRKAACGWSGNLFSLLKLLGRTKEFLGERQVQIFEQLKVLVADEDEVVEESPTLEVPEITPPIFWQRVYEDPYLRSRGFTDAQFEKFEVGRSRVNPEYVTFLIRQGGRLVGYLGRSERPKAEIDELNEKRKLRGEPPYPRYDNSKSTDFARLLGGLDEVVPGVTEDVILVEGVFSKTKTDENLNLDSSPLMKCCFTFGAKLSPEQLSLLSQRGVRRLICWFEADVLKQVKHLVAVAAEQFEVLVGYLPTKDPGDLNREEALSTLASSVHWVEFNNTKVQSKLKKT